VEEILHECKKDVSPVLRRIPSLLCFREQSTFTPVVLHDRLLILSKNLLIASYCIDCILHYTAVLFRYPLQTSIPTGTSRYSN
jgi:hypothetical protein